MGARALLVTKLCLALSASVALLAFSCAIAAAAGTPIVSAQSLADAADSEVDVMAEIDPNGASTTYHVEYGTTEAYGQSTLESGPLGSYEASQPVRVSISNLAAETTYHFRFVATNSAGATDGLDGQFTTYAAPPLSSGCPNEARRQEQNVLALANCRAYEMVSPLDKNGSDVMGQPEMVEASIRGDSASFAADAGFGQTSGSGAGGFTQYLATRDPSTGWSTHGITPTPAVDAFQFAAGATVLLDLSASLERALVTGYDLPGTKDDTPLAENLYMENTGSGLLETVSTPLGSEVPSTYAVTGGFKAASSDLGVVAFESTSNFLPQTSGSEPKLYAWEHGALKIAGILPGGTLPASGSTSAAFPGVGFTWGANRGAVSSDGSKVLFMATPNGASQPQLYVRKDGLTTAWVSQSEASTPVAEPENVVYKEMSSDGSRVLFATTDQLLDSDPGGEGYALYMYTDSPDPEMESNLTFIGRMKGSEASAPAGMSENGERFYFFTEADSEFTRGGLYVWDEGSIRFVAPTTHPFNEGASEVSADGRRLAFLYDGSLDGAPVGTGGLQAMYVYDESSDKLLCASCPPTGQSTASSAAVEPAATKAIVNLVTDYQVRFLSSDGRYVFFSTADPLVARDTNGVEDAYEYEIQSGRVSLLSTGTGESGAWLAAADAEGKNVFIATRQRLLGQDTDTLVDLYDVRVEGGFPQPGIAISECVGDECQGTPSAAPTFNTASGFSGLGNIVASAEKPSARHKQGSTRAHKLARALRACRHRHGRARKRCEARARKKYTKTSSKRASRRAGR